ncbi:MAG: hypothetical protein EF813_03635 [Methanosarcinales archaeon]|nr:MAG: hypothetical protein EF813_03635 [Methanosarcinales archaeon]
MLVTLAASAIVDDLAYTDYAAPDTIPPIEIQQGSIVTSRVSITNHGNLCYDASLKFPDPPDLPPGITISPAESRILDAGKTTWYQITIHASENASVGTFTIQIADNIANDPYTWQSVELSIVPPPLPTTPAPTARVTPIARSIPTRSTGDGGAEAGGMDVSSVVRVILITFVATGIAIALWRRR